MIRQGNAFCLQNLGACCGCLELFVDSPVSYPLHLLLSWAHMVGSPLCMPGLSWETEAYMAQWKPLTRAVLPSISGRVSPTSASFFFFFLTDVQVVCFLTGALGNCELRKRQLSEMRWRWTSDYVFGSEPQAFSLPPSPLRITLSARGKHNPPSKAPHRCRNTKLVELSSFLSPVGRQTRLLVSIWF